MSQPALLCTISLSRQLLDLCSAPSCSASKIFFARETNRILCRGHLCDVLRHLHTLLRDDLSTKTFVGHVVRVFLHALLL